MATQDSPCPEKHFSSRCSREFCFSAKVPICTPSTRAYSEREENDTRPASAYRSCLSTTSVATGFLFIRQKNGKRKCSKECHATSSLFSFPPRKCLCVAWIAVSRWRPENEPRWQGTDRQCEFRTTCCYFPPLRGLLQSLKQPTRNPSTGTKSLWL